MKNLKKVLALVLVVAMMMGFATVAGAADFTDAADVSHDEAVDVMTAIGVINGYPDGSFRPEGNVTRAQMAKMVAYIVAGGEDVGSLYAGATAFSDCLTHWARGYIAYANTTGIIAGVGGGRFNPDGNVTGAQAAKMMLCALGYKQDTEGYTGTGWSVNVLADARTVGLLDGLNGVNMNAALNREDAAQLMFNALKATMVEYPRGNTVVNGGDGTTVIIGGSEATYVGNSVSKDYRVSGGDAYMQMCEYYFEDLELNAGSPDDFGRPANKWEYKNDAIGTYAKEADATYTAAVKSKDIYSDLGLSRTTTATVTEDGADKGTFSVGKNDSTNKIGGNGVLVEAYVDDDKNVDLIVINTYVGEVTAVHDDVDEPYSTITGITGAGGTYETTVFEEDDIVLYTYASKEIQSVKLAEEVSGAEVTSFKTDSGKYTSLTADGTGYDMAKGYDIDSEVGSTLTRETSYDLYLDDYGYVIYVGYYEAASNDYAYVLDAKKMEDDWEVADKYNTAKLLFADGTVATVKTDNEDTPTDLKGKWVTYTVDDDDVYTLNAKTTVTQVDSAAINQIKITNGTASFEVNATGKTAETYYANSNTVFIVYTKDSDEYTVYTGIANVPSIKTSAGAAATAQSVALTASSSDMAKYVYISLADSTNVSGATGDVIYIVAGSKSDLITDDLGEYYEYNAVVDGEITTLKVNSTTAGTIGSSDQVVKGVTTNTKGIVTGLGSAVSGLQPVAVKTEKASAGTIGLGGKYYSYAEDVAVYKIEDNKITESSINGIRNDDDDKATFVVDSGEVTHIFIKVVTANAPGGEDTTSYKLDTAPTVTVSAGQISFTGAVIKTSANAFPSEDIEDLTITVTVEDRTSGTWAEFDTATITPVKVSKTDGTLDTTTASVGVVTGTSYRVTITLSGGEFGTMTLFSGTVAGK